MAGGVAAAGAAVLAAAVAVGGVAALGRSPGPSPYPTSFTSGGARPTVHRSAARLLSRVAGAAAMDTPVVANGRQFAYTESQVSFGADGAPAPAQTHERQIWLPVADWCAGGLLVEHGQRTSLKFPSSGVSVPAGNGAPATPVREKCPDPGSLSDPTYRLLQSLPTDPRVLLHRLRQVKTGGLSPDAVVFGTIGDLIRESVLPPRLGAALYRAAALIPGVTVIQVATDAIGRPGVAVSLSVRGYQQEWIFDRRSCLLLGEREFMHGILVGKTAILSQAIVDRAGELPPGG
ncbi:MAG TPA: CU044_5270 family protein [Streptosporangiaceae bacterium]